MAQLNYAYVIVLASFLGHFIICGLIYIIGVFYVVFREVYGESNKSVAVLTSLTPALMFGCSPVSSALASRFGPRVICFTGGMLAAVGYFFSAFVSKFELLCVTFGVLPGFGMALSYIPLLVQVGQHFHKGRTLAMAVAVSGGGAGNIALAPLCQMLMDYYGWRGCSMILSGLTLNLCVLGMLLRPANITEETKIQEITLSENINTEVFPQTTQESIVVPSKEEEALALQMNDSKTRSIVRTLKTCPELFNLRIFGNPSFTLICVNNFFIYVGAMMVYTHLPEYTKTVNLSPYQGSLLISLLGVGNMVGRIMAGLVVCIPHIMEVDVLTTEFIVCAILATVIPLTESFTILACIVVVFGLIFGSMCAILPQVIVDILGLKQLNTAYGYIAFSDGVGSFVGPVIAELLYGWSGRYSYSFFFGGACLLVSSILAVYPCWTIHRSATKTVQ